MTTIPPAATATCCERALVAMRTTGPASRLLQNRTMVWTPCRSAPKIMTWPATLQSAPIMNIVAFKTVHSNVRARGT